LGLALVSAARLATLATGRGGAPSGDEWPVVGLALVLVALAGMRLLLAAGLTKLEAATVAAGAPLLVLVDAPLGDLSPGLSLSANFAGCVLPLLVAVKVVATPRRLPVLEAIIAVGVAILVAFLSSHVVPERGVLLQYRVPALVIGVVAAALFHSSPERAGAAGFAAGAIGVLVGADLLHLRELAQSGGAGRVILGGAGLLDGILLVSLLAALVATCTAVLTRALFRTRVPAGAT